MSDDAALLAQTGFAGARTIFDGRFGFFELYQPKLYDAAVLLRDLETAFRGETLSYRPEPSAGRCTRRSAQHHDGCGRRDTRLHSATTMTSIATYCGG